MIWHERRVRHSVVLLRPYSRSGCQRGITFTGSSIRFAEPGFLRPPLNLTCTALAGSSERVSQEFAVRRLQSRHSVYSNVRIPFMSKRYLEATNRQFQMKNHA